MTDTMRFEPVIAAACPDYSESSADHAISEVLSHWPGFEAVTPGTKIAVKVNLVSAKAPDTAATTHPAFVTALCRRLVERGAEVTVGDSPGGLFTREALSRCYRVSGMTAVEEAGAKLNYDTSTSEVSFPDAVSAHVFSCTSWLRDADLIINFAKLKTHGMIRMTCAVKNLFGTIPGTTKPEYHMRFPEVASFSNMLIDLNEYFRPCLNLVDAVTCMEGNGPTAGSPRHLGLLLASERPYALDLACAGLIGLTREDVPTLEQAYRRGLGPSDLSEVTVIGEDLNHWRIPNFRPAAGKDITFSAGGPLGRIVKPIFTRAMQQVPKVTPAECISCKKCYHVCPAHAITMRRAGGAQGRSDGVNPHMVPHIDRSRCIRCFCCQEFCPVGAMKVHRTSIARFLQQDRA